MWINTDGLPKLIGSVAYLGFDFEGGGRVQINFRKVGPYAARGKATRLLGEFGGMLPQENLFKLCNLVRFSVYFASSLSKNNFTLLHKNQ